MRVGKNSCIRTNSKASAATTASPARRDSVDKDRRERRTTEKGSRSGGGALPSPWKELLISSNLRVEARSAATRSEGEGERS